MLSILIPVYNNKVTKLVKELHDQCIRAKIEFEILVFDDGSKEKIKLENKTLNGIFGINYLELSENIGRSKIRNMLAKTASYEYLLFLDADSKIHSRKFIKNYVQELDTKRVLNGGRIYSKKPPRAKSKLLHWSYGTKNESQIAEKRNIHPARYFHTNNFVIPKSIMLQNPFDESLNQYGYEDLLFAHELESKSIQILHVDNFIIHNELEPKKSFISKQEQALENLNRLVLTFPTLDVRIWNTYKQIKVYRLLGITTLLLGKPEKWKKKLLDSSNSILHLQVYKLLYFIYLNK